MRVLVLGAGGIGGYFGGRMAEAGTDTTFLVRPRRAAQLAADGLVVRSPKGDITRPVQFTETATPGFDAVILSCKAFDLDSAMDAVAPAMVAGCAILPLLNGMAHMDALVSRFGAAAVLGGQCQIAATLDPDGTVRHLGALAALSLGERDGSLTPRVEALAAALAPAGGKASTTVEQDMWEKWVFLSSLAALTCLMRASIADVVAAGGDWLGPALFDEAAAVATAAGHTPRAGFTDRMRAMLAQPGLVFTASMMRDMEAGSRIEAAHIIGDLIARGNAAAMPLFRLAALATGAYEARRTREG